MVIGFWREGGGLPISIIVDNPKILLIALLQRGTGQRDAEHQHTYSNIHKQTELHTDTLLDKEKDRKTAGR